MSAIEGPIDRPTYAALLADLAARGLAARPLDDRDSAWADLARGAVARERAQATPFVIRFFIGFGTWVGAALISSVLACSGILQSPGAALVLGPFALAAAAFVRRRLRGDVAVQATLALGFGGQILILGALEGLHVPNRGLMAAFVALQAVAVAAIPDPLHRFLSALAGAFVAAMLAADLQIPGGVDGIAVIAGAYVLLAWLFDAKIAVAGFSPIVRPVAFGLAAAFLGVLSANLHLISAHWDASPLVETVAFAGLLLAVVATALAEAGRPVGSAAGKIAAAGVLAVGALTFQTPGVLGAAFLLVLGRLRGERLLEGLGLAALGWFLFAYFTEIGQTLLARSFIVGGTGAILLVARALISRGTGAPPAEAEAASAPEEPARRLQLVAATALAAGVPALLAIFKELSRR